MKNFVIAIGICSCFLIACNNSGESTGSETKINTDSTLLSPPSLTSGATDELQFSDSTAATSQALTQPLTTQPGTAVAEGMNPPHGQPGHRCEIPVGAPLNSEPTKTATPSATTGGNTPVLTTPSSPVLTPQPASTAGSTPAATPAGMNPPHGQPGHDCAIPVGSPLKK